MIELMRERIIIQKSSLKTDKAGNHAAEWKNYYKCFSYFIGKTAAGALLN